MKVSALRRALPTVIILLIVVLSGVAVYRHFRGGRSHLVAGFSPAGKDELSVAIELSPSTYDPTTSDSIHGIDYEILTRIAREHGLKIDFHPYTNVEEALKGLDEGRYDLVVGDLTATTDLRAKGYILTKDIYLDHFVLAQLRNPADTLPRIDTQLKLKTADTIWVPAGVHYRRRLENLAAELGDSLHFVPAPGATSEHLAIAVVDSAATCGNSDVVVRVDTVCHAREFGPFNNLNVEQARNNRQKNKGEFYQNDPVARPGHFQTKRAFFIA